MSAAMAFLLSASNLVYCPVAIGLVFDGFLRLGFHGFLRFLSSSIFCHIHCDLSINAIISFLKVV